jgi:hypothetical protein
VQSGEVKEGDGFIAFVPAIDDFPDDNLLWRIEWIGGVGFNTSVPSDPLMDVCIAQPPAGETNPLSARFCTVANNVGDSVALNVAFNTSFDEEDLYEANGRSQ